MPKVSDAARAVARDVLESVGKGKIPNKTKIAIKRGYAPTTAGAGRVTQTKTYQREIAPLVQRLEDERNAIVERLKKTRNKAKYRDLIDGLDKITKNIQLLTGGATANVAIGVKKMKDEELEYLATRSPARIS